MRLNTYQLLYSLIRNIVQRTSDFFFFRGSGGIHLFIYGFIKLVCQILARSRWTSSFLFKPCYCEFSLFKPRIQKQSCVTSCWMNCRGWPITAWLCAWSPMTNDHSQIVSTWNHVALAISSLSVLCMKKNYMYVQDHGLAEFEWTMHATCQQTYESFSQVNPSYYCSLFMIKHSITICSLFSPAWI